MKFRKLHVPMERYIAVAQTRPKPPRLVIVHVSRIQKSGTGDNNFVNWKNTFRSDRTVKVDHLQSWFQIFRSDQTEVVSSV